jgi:hypothetical protein
MPVRRVVVGTVVAGLAAWILSTHIFAAIDLLRVKIVQSPLAAVDGRVSATTAGFSQVNDLAPPVALIARVRNSSVEDGTFSFAIDGTVVCEQRVRAASVRRVDCEVTSGWSSADQPRATNNEPWAHLVTIDARQGRRATSTPLAGATPTPLKDWTLESVELATHHGSASSTHFLVVLPESSNRYTRPSSVWVGITSFLFFILVAFPAGAAWPRVGRGPRILRWGRPPYMIFAGALTVLLITIQCSQWLTRFRVVLSADTLLIWLAVLLAPHTGLAIRWGLRRIKTAEDQPASKQQATSLAVVARAAIVAFVVFAIYGIVVRTRLRDSYHGNYSGMLLISQQLFDGNPLFALREDVRKTLVFGEDGGYDAQFMYFAAFDPLMRVFKDHPVMYRQVMDAAPYRFGRIGFTWLTWVFSGGRWEWYPAAMVWLVLSSLAAAAFTLSVMAQEHGLSSAIGGLVVAVPGFWLSLLSGLPEPIAAATLLGGLLFLSRGRPWLAGGLFALSLLVRETGVVIVVCVVGAALIAGRSRHGSDGALGVREARIVALVAGGALLAWRLYVAWILASDWGLQAIPSNPGLSWPFAGVVDLWRSIVDGQYASSSSHLSRAAIALSLLLIGGFVLALALAAARHDATSVAAVIYGVMAICLSYAKVWLFVGNTERVTYELFLALALSCLTIRAYSKPLQRGLIAFWSCSVVYVFFLTFDAAYIRSALAVPF